MAIIDKSGRFATAVQRADAVQPQVAPFHTTLVRLLPRAIVSLVLTAAMVWLLWDRWVAIDGKALADAFARVSPVQWITALGFTAVSFWAVGRYDGVLHQHLATRTPLRIARRAGVCAIAVSQALGLGLISGAILRWRMLPDTSLWQATRLTGAVALSFLAAWAVVTALILLTLPNAPYRDLAGLAFGLAALLAAGALAGPLLAPKLSLTMRQNFGRWGWRWPNGLTLLRLIGLCAVDTIAASLALYLLLPAGTDLPYAALLPAFLLALGAGLALGTPGGLGAFEVTFFAILPLGQTPDLMAAILGWRLVYFAVPAVIGAAFAVFGPEKPALPLALRPNRAAPRAEFGLSHQGLLDLVPLAGQDWLLNRRAHFLISVLDPLPQGKAPALDIALQELDRLAQSEARLAIAYKASGRLAARARRLGKATRCIAHEAWITPRHHRLTSPALAGLRRKLRRAESAGVNARHCPADLVPWPALDQIAADWKTLRGSERGFSMGRHARSYLRHQRIYIAWSKDSPIAYVSFHATPSEWVLDLMRHGADIPDGTMHALVQTAIEDAAAQGVARLSLAAVPDMAFGPRDLWSRLMVRLAPETTARGLVQFKSSFAPRWTPLYLIAANRAVMAAAALSLWRAIVVPPPLMPEIEQGDADYEFALPATPWHIRSNR